VCSGPSGSVRLCRKAGIRAGPRDLEEPGGFAGDVQSPGGLLDIAGDHRPLPACIRRREPGWRGESWPRHSAGRDRWMS
jgi:hypothetical protein